MLRYLFLALLAARSRHGYELKAAFEEVMGGTWPLNIGQVYTGLSKLEAEGLVECAVVTQDLLPDRKVYSVTETGRKELERWLDEDTQPQVRLRDELFLKVLAQGVAGGIGGDTIWRQREAYLQLLSRLTVARADERLHPATALLIDGAIFRAEADLRWLDLCEQRLRDGEV